jgi:hypothetical protein
MTFTGSKPNVYSASGTHAVYATAGSQDYTIALGLVADTTGAGFGWDMTQNYRGYWYDTSSDTFSVALSAGIGATEEASETASWL